MCTRQGRYRVAVSYSYDGKGVVGGLALGGRMAERRRDAEGEGRRVRVGDWGWMRKGGRTLGVSHGGGSGGGGGGSGPTEGGEDRDTKGFDVQPFHRLYFSAPFYPFAARALARSLATPRITLLYTPDPPARAKSSHRLMLDNSRRRDRSREYFLGFSTSRPTPISSRFIRESLNRASR